VPAFSAWPNTGDVFYGFANGAIDVFPEDSLPQLCRSNITTIYDAIMDLFVDWSYVYPDDEIEIVEDIQHLLQFPYGTSFSCYFFIYQVFIAEYDPLADGELTEEEALESSIILVNDVLTNVLFNLGYMYNDILQTLTLVSTELKFWEKQGRYWGDFFIRFWYRRSFLTNFEY